MRFTALADDFERCLERGRRTGGLVGTHGIDLQTHHVRERTPAQQRFVFRIEQDGVPTCQIAALVLIGHDAQIAWRATGHGGGAIHRDRIDDVAERLLDRERVPGLQAAPVGKCRADRDRRSAPPVRTELRWVVRARPVRKETAGRGFRLQ